ncbi:YhcN/YlaJ family sporulation lipoprotein [Bacillus sp. B6(2022)]|nr:YhcN/YlaJ family sporulation lipoprotein [Bacillus sp. B6(2022)]
MMKQLTATILLCMLLGGCGFQSGMNRQVDEDSSSKTIRLSDRHEGNNSNMPEADTNRAGYVRYQRQQVTDQKERTPALNREHLAHVITSLAIQLPNIKDAATLVTDEDALIVYRTGNKNRDESADQVKKQRFLFSLVIIMCTSLITQSTFNPLPIFHVFKPIHVILIKF